MASNISKERVVSHAFFCPNIERERGSRRDEGDAKYLGSAHKLEKIFRILVGFLYPTLMEENWVSVSHHFMDCNIKNICRRANQPTLPHCPAGPTFSFMSSAQPRLAIVIDPNLASSLEMCKLASKPASQLRAEVMCDVRTKLR